MRDEEMFLDELQPTDPLDLELCSPISTFFPELELGDSPQGKVEVLNPSASLNGTNSVSESCKKLPKR